MPLLNEYRNLGKDLSKYVKELSANSGAKGLQEAFRQGGKLFDTIQMLTQREKKINNYGTNLLEAFATKPEEISPSYVTQRIAANDSEIKEITLLKNRLQELSSSIGRKASGFAITKFVNEFSKGVERCEKIQEGFFSTLAKFIVKIFEGKKGQNLTQALSDLDSRISVISKESQERFSILVSTDANIIIEPAGG